MCYFAAIYFAAAFSKRLAVLIAFPLAKEDIVFQESSELRMIRYSHTASMKLYEQDKHMGKQLK